MPGLISCLIILALFTLSTSGQIKPSYTTAAPIDYVEDEAEDLDDAFNCPEECGLYSAEDTVIFIFIYLVFQHLFKSIDSTWDFLKKISDRK